ncbi:hypothetical protein V6U90_28370 [Micromonospora sp. CPCC 206060]|uniref:sulfotransferase-like domain-containing protein n=1 Tax=Micromonospora sp. CPCC 206060 TaxID=3122406 RepID=UPI002FF01697
MPPSVAPRRTIAVWAAPRSVSTAFEKTFANRSDTTVVHEPFTDCYYFGRARRSDRYGEQPHKADRDGRWAVAQIDGNDGPVVFVKDLAFQAEPYLSDDYLAGITNTFILRHPATVLASLSPLKPDFTEEEFGFLALGRLWRRVHALGQSPVVVEGDTFRSRPAAVLGEYCDRVGLAFDPRMLHWNDGRIRPWSPDEQESQAKWHATLESSTSIIPPATRPPVPVPARLRPAYDRAVRIYEEICDARVRRPIVA